MSSSLYARYIPPKKKVTVEPIAAPIAAPLPARPTPAKPTPQPLQSHTPQPFIHPSRVNPNIVPAQQPNKASKRKHENSTAAQDGPGASSKKAKKSSNIVNTPKAPQRPPPPIQQVPTSQYESKDEKRAAKLARRAHQRALEQGLEVEEKPTYQAPVKAVEEIIPEVQPKEKKIPKRPKKKAENADDARSKQEAEEDAKHKSVLAKRAKSLKKGEKIVRKERERALERGEDVEMKDAEALPEEPVELHALEPLPQPEPLPEAEPISIYSALPSWLGSPTRVAPTATASFEDLGLSKVIIEPLKKAGFENAFAVQAAVLPLLLPGPLHQPGDVLVSAATGSGKTLSYVLPMVNDISQTTVTQLRGLIVMPTRELVTQAREVCDICASAYTTGSRRHVNVGVAVGNQTLKQEQASLMKQEYVYNPKEYGARQKRINAMWSASVIESDGNPNLMEEEDDLAPLDHLVKSSPKVDILICTPGRLVEHLKTTRGFTLAHLKWLVIDEADKLLDQSFQQWLETVMASLSSREQVAASQQQSKSGVTKVVLSATMTRDIGLLTQLKLNKPKFVVLEGSEEDAEAGKKRTETLNLPASLHESAVKIDDEGLKPLYLLEVLKRNGLLTPTSSIKDVTDDSSSSSSSDSDSSEDDSSDDDTSSDGSSSEESSDADSSSDDSSDDDSSPSSDASSTSSASSKTTLSKEPTITASHSNPRGVLIFTKSNENAVRLTRLLALLSPSHASMIGTITSTTSRKRTLRSFRTGKLSILIASDLVARGLDLPDLAHVVNYDMPSSLTSYVHRVGRTARAGKEGAATTLFTAAEGRWFWNDIARNGLKRTGKVERVTISAKDLFTKDDKERYETALEQLGKEASGSGDKK